MRLTDRLRNIFDDLVGTALTTNNVDGVGFQMADYMLDMDPLAQTVDGYSGSDSMMSMLDMPAREAEGLMTDGMNMSRRQRYLSYDSLEELVPEVDATLNLYADEATSYDSEYHTISIRCSNQGVREELEFLFFKLIQIDDKAYAMTRSLAKYGDYFGELVVDPNNPQLGVMKLNDLDPYTMWRIQTRRGKLLEFQQTRMSPDYDIVTADLQAKWAKDNAEETELAIQWAARGRYDKQERPGLIRFAPGQIIHMALGGEKRGHAPYGTSILVSARKAAYNLRLLEDSMLLYRLVRAPERRVYYIDLGQLPPNRVESFVQEFRNKVKRKKIYNEKTGQIDERYNPWSVDDDLFLPVRANSNTRVDTLPGAQNLGEIDDAMYFRRKFYLSVGIPPGYLEQTIEAQTNRLTLSSQAMVFAKKVYRIQRVLAKALTEIATRHLILQGVPETLYEDLSITVTPPSEWRELAQAEVLNSRATLASQYSSLNVVSGDYVRMEIMHLSEDENEEEKRRMFQQKIEEAEVAAQASLIAARANAEIERGNQINQAKMQAELAAATGSVGGEPPPPEGPGGGGLEPNSLAGAESPTVDQLAAAAPEPSADIFQTEPTAYPASTRPRRTKLDPADAEAEREGA